MSNTSVSRGSSVILFIGWLVGKSSPRSPNSRNTSCDQEWAIQVVSTVLVVRCRAVWGVESFPARCRWISTGTRVAGTMFHSAFQLTQSMISRPVSNRICWIDPKSAFNDVHRSRSMWNRLKLFNLEQISRRSEENESPTGWPLVSSRGCRWINAFFCKSIIFARSHRIFATFDKIWHFSWLGNVSLIYAGSKQGEQSE